MQKKDKKLPFVNKKGKIKRFSRSFYSDFKNEYYQCKKCESQIKKDIFFENYKICPKCGYIERLNADEFIIYFFDSFEEIEYKYFSGDPLKFYDLKGKYIDRLNNFRNKYKRNDAIILGKSGIKDITFYSAIMDFRIFGGSLNIVVGRAIIDLIYKVIDEKSGLLIVSQSGGARMHEGLFSLMQMAKIQAALVDLKNSKSPYFSLMLNPTTGGVAASYAMIGDLNIAEEKAIIGFAGRRVIEQNIGEKLPDDFQTAEFQKEHGFVDIVINRTELKEFLYKIFKFFLPE